MFYIQNIHKISLPINEELNTKIAYARLFQIGTFQDIIELLKDNSINIEKSKIIDKENLIFFFNENQLDKIREKLPWLIMKVYSESLFTTTNLETINVGNLLTKKSSGREPIVGVIDSGFNKDSPFSSFIVKNEDHRKDKSSSSKRETIHGTAVSSLIIANDQINPSAPDGLGNLRIKHFEVLQPGPNKNKSSVNWAFIYKKLKEIVEMNPNVKVWNLSFGAPRNDDFTISLHGILLDKLSFDGQRIFVVAAGNDRKKSKDENHSLNSPADSVNSISVGSIYYNNDKNKVERALYSSLGFSLQTIKPDVSGFGGPTLINGEKALIHDGVSLKGNINGTSLSAPKITRQIAYLISKGYAPQEAKSKVISMTTKEKPSLASSRFGYNQKKKQKL